MSLEHEICTSFSAPVVRSSSTAAVDDESFRKGVARISINFSMYQVLFPRVYFPHAHLIPKVDVGKRCA